MIRIAFIFIALIILSSCHQKSKDETVQNDEPSYDYLFDQIEKQTEQKKQDYISTMQEKSIAFEQYGDCDDALEDTIHHHQTPYINSSEIKDSSLFVDFKFIDSCCQDFFGNFKIENDTLVFKFEAVGTTACDCYCWYQYNLRIKNISEKFSAFELVYW